MTAIFRAKPMFGHEARGGPDEFGESALKSHRFSVGQTVYFTARSMGRAGASGSYKIVKLLPSDGEDYQYRIKSTDETFERVAKESQLDRAL